MTALTTPAAAPAGPPGPPPGSPGRRPGRSPGIVQQVVAGLAVVAGAPALAGVLQGWLWLSTAALAVALVVGVGLLVRATGPRPWWVTVPAQAVALLVLLTILFGQDAPLGVIPGPAAVGGLLDQLGALDALIETAVPPLAATGPLLLLVCLAFGIFGITVDALTAAGHGPAAGGLVLLCAFTVATTLSRTALPNWALVAGAAGFALLLLADHRHRQRYRAADAVPEPDAGGAPAGRWSAALAGGRSHSLGLVIAAAAAAVALLVGALATAIGTEGRFPGNAPDQNAQSLQFGLSPWTSIRNQLSKPDPVDLLKVRGLPPTTYLRALSLSEYQPAEGWQLPDRLDGTVLDATLPTGLPTPPSGPVVTVEVENLALRDRWLPLAGLPLGVTGVSPNRWRYDTSTATAHSPSAVFEPRWTERAVTQSPGAAVLNSVPSTTDVAPVFLSTAGVDPRITRLAASITARASTPFARAAALNRYFLDPANGFRYDLAAPPGNSGDRLVDFLDNTRTGYCEQYASAMAIMLRAVGVPARVAIGFTRGEEDAGVRTISTRDAHAWAEGFFPGYGWLMFDATPLGDGRTALPDYLSGAAGSDPLVGEQPPGDGEEETPDNPEQTSQAPPAPPPAPMPGPDGAPASPEPAAPGDDQAGAQDTGPPDGGSGQDEAAPEPGSGGIGPLWQAVLIGLLIALALIALAGAPAAVRRLARHRRTTLAGRGGAEGAAAAWREVVAESVDRGGAPPDNRTVRSAAKNLVLSHRLDHASSHAVRAVVDAVERGWYGPRSASVPGSELVAALREAAAGLDRAAPLTIADRVWPRSVRPGAMRGSRPKPGAEPDPSGVESAHARSGAGGS